MFETRLQQQDHLVVVHFYEYQRSPAALPEALRLSPIVNAHLHEIGDGATLIAYPEQVVAVANYLQAHGVLWRDGSRLMERGRWDQLRRRHIMFSEDFREAVLASILDRPGTGADNGRGRQNIRVRRNKWVGIHMSWASRTGGFRPGLAYWASGGLQLVTRRQGDRHDDSTIYHCQRERWPAKDGLQTLWNTRNKILYTLNVLYLDHLA